MKNEHLKPLLDLLHQGIAFFDGNGTYLFANKAYRRMFNFKGSEPVGKNVCDYFSTGQSGIMTAMREKREIKGPAFSYNGMYGFAYRTPLMDKNGDVYGAVAEVISASLDQNNVKHLIKLINDWETKTKYYEMLSRNNSRTLHTFDSMVGDSMPMRNLKEQGQRFAQGNQPILVTGESGVGKELVVQALHMASPRSRAPFVAINCAALPESLVESELFGYASGAFSGAHRTGMKGKFEIANGGTIFLDEIGELPLAMQAKLLRVLETGEIQKLGSSSSITVDIRLVSATNRDLEKMVEKGTFREDLYHRINVLLLVVPPLRERTIDIPFLVINFLEEFIGVERAHRLIVSKEVFDMFERHRWKGNIRELKNLISYALYTLNELDNMITAANMPEKFLKEIGRQGKEGAEYRNTVPARDISGSSGSISGIMDSLERELIRNALRENGNNRNKAARALGRSRSWIYKRMYKLAMS